MKFKRLARHIPAILGVAGTIAASIVASHFRNEMKKLEQAEPFDGNYIRLHPAEMEGLNKGYPLLYRRKRIGPDEFYSQSTTLDHFSAVADKQWNEREAAS